MKAAPRALLLPGPMSHACSDAADVMRLEKGAGCLICESEHTPARAEPPGVIPGSGLSARPGMTAEFVDAVVKN